MTVPYVANPNEPSHKLSQSDHFNVATQDRAYGGQTVTVFDVDGSSGKTAITDLTASKLTQAGAKYTTSVAGPKSAAYTVGANDAIVIVAPSGADVPITLPVASTMVGREIVVKNVGGANNAVLTPTGTDKIEGANATHNVAAGTWARLFAGTGTAGWFIIG